MDKKMIKKMMDYGVSAEVVLKLMLDDDESEASPKEKPEAAEKEKPTGAEEENPKKVSGNETSKEDPVLKAIEHLTGMIASQNIRRDYRDSQQETADDILAKVLINKGDENERK